MPASRLAVLLFIASEAVFFTLLILAYVILHGSGSGPSAAGSLDARRTFVFSLFLFASSFTFWLAERRLRRGDRFGFALLLNLTVVLGIVFLCGQAVEWAGLIRRGVVPSRDPFATGFFTLTGFHGLHVIAGLCLLVATALVGARRAAGERGRAAVAGIGYYWHFVDAVWVAIFAVVYLGAAL